MLQLNPGTEGLLNPRPSVSFLFRSPLFAPSREHRMHSLDLDECIEKLKRRELLREEILEAICEQVKEVLMRESNVVHVAAPITVVGDIHG